MNYYLAPKTFNSKRCVMRCKLISMGRDISYYNLADGLIAFDRYVEAWKDFSTAMSIELFVYGDPIKRWTPDEGVTIDMGKLSQSNKATFQSAFVTAGMKTFLRQHSEHNRFMITGIKTDTSNQGKSVYRIDVSFLSEFTYTEPEKTNDDTGEVSPAFSVTVKPGQTKELTLENDATRFAVFNKAGDSYIGDELPYGPCMLAWKGKYQLIEEADEGDENWIDAPAEPAASGKGHKK